MKKLFYVRRHTCADGSFAWCVLNGHTLRRAGKPFPTRAKAEAERANSAGEARSGQGASPQANAERLSADAAHHAPNRACVAGRQGPAGLHRLLRRLADGPHLRERGGPEHMPCSGRCTAWSASRLRSIRTTTRRRSKRPRRSWRQLGGNGSRGRSYVRTRSPHTEAAVVSTPSWLRGWRGPSPSRAPTAAI